MDNFSFENALVSFLTMFLSFKQEFDSKGALKVRHLTIASAIQEIIKQLLKIIAITHVIVAESSNYLHFQSDCLLFFSAAAGVDEQLEEVYFEGLKKRKLLQLLLSLSNEYLTHVPLFLQLFIQV